ncbi:MAG: radical SAM protein, partial [Phycisphaerales bacterium]|nr:radical SAM protein [Phycisphaerales bacterium]
EFGGKTVLQRTLERLGSSRKLESIVLLAPDGWDENRLIDRGAIGLPVIVERCGDGVFGSEREAIIAARLWSDTSWRGGIGGMSIYDEVLAPRPMLAAMERRGLTAAVLCGPDWPLVDVSEHTGVDALVARHQMLPERMPLVFTQAPPGVSGCLVGIGLLRELCTGNRLCTIGSMLVYQPHAPQHDPIARDANVQIDHGVRRSLVRATFDTPRYKLRMRRAVEPLVLDRDDRTDRGARGGGLLEPARCIGAIEQQWMQLPTFTPPHVVVELCTGRFASGAFSPHRGGSIQRSPMTLRQAERILSQLGESRDTVVTFDGVGDPLRHPDLHQIVAIAKAAGVRGVHVRTELLCGRDAIDRLVAAGVDVVSVDLHADRAATYKAMMGVDRFKEALLNLEHLVSVRRRLSDLPGAAGFCLPWVVPRLQRRVESYEDIEPFFDRWSHLLGAALLEGPPPFDPQPHRPADALLAARAPLRVMRREGLRRMTVFSDGRVPVSELDRRGEGDIAADLSTTGVLDAWRELFSRRRRLLHDEGEDTEALRTVGP